MKMTFNQNGSGPLQIQVLKAISGDFENQSMVDLCCGSTPQTGHIGFKEKEFVDCVDRHLVGGGKLIVSDVIEYLKNNKKEFDVSISTDTIEHFRDNDANVFLDLTSKVSKKQIWFTPLGEYCMTTDPNDNNPDSHKSEWTPEKLEKRNPGYWNFIVFPNWHPTLGNNGLGAFFFWHCEDLKEDFERVKNELKNLK
jgi:hypothetical protein